MRITLGVAAGALVIAAALSGCSKPATQTTADAAAAPAAAASGAAAGAGAPGGAVSPPQSPENSAVNTDANKTENTQTPGSNSFTEKQAREHLKNGGYTDVSGLTKTPDGMWVGKAAKDGKTMDVSVDFKGAISAK